MSRQIAKEVVAREIAKLMMKVGEIKKLLALQDREQKVVSTPPASATPIQTEDKSPAEPQPLPPASSSSENELVTTATIRSHKVRAEQTLYCVKRGDGKIFRETLHSDIREDLLDQYNGEIIVILGTKEKLREGKLYRVRFSNDIHTKRWEPELLINRICDIDAVFDPTDAQYKRLYPQGRPRVRKKRRFRRS